MLLSCRQTILFSICVACGSLYILLHLIWHTILIRYRIFLLHLYRIIPKNVTNKTVNCYASLRFFFKATIRELQKCDTPALSREFQLLKLSVIELCKHPAGNGPSIYFDSISSVKKIPCPFIYLCNRIPCTYIWVELLDMSWVIYPTGVYIYHADSNSNI